MSQIANFLANGIACILLPPTEREWENPSDPKIPSSWWLYYCSNNVKITSCGFMGCFTSVCKYIILTTTSSYCSWQESEISEIRAQNKLASEEGPCVKQLENDLQTIGVQRQAYHGGEFVGNHVNKCCKVWNTIPLYPPFYDAKYSTYNFRMQA